jgi:murein DD-endopeptidase MepM/ murein hydrolase activator NlpD
MYQRTIDSQGNVLRAGDVDYAELTLSGRQLAIYRFIDASGQVDYYNSKGESVRKALLRTPVDGARITSKFGMRVNPILGFSMMHKGVDFGVPMGTPVMAAGSGTVELAGQRGAYGLYIRLKHDKIHSTAYAHLSALAKGMKAGRKVMQGQVIGYVGESGRATGPHLHYEVLVNNAQVNPMSVKFKAGSVLAGRDLSRFKSVVAEIESRLAGTPLSTQVALARRAGN